jgi:hypothetical protein
MLNITGVEMAVQFRIEDELPQVPIGSFVLISSLLNAQTL